MNLFLNVMNQVSRTAFFLFFCFFSYISSVVYAADGCDADTLFCNPIKYNNLGELLVALMDGLITILIPIVTLGIVYIGFMMVVSGSKPEDRIKWRNALLYALLGLFLVLGTKGILSVIQNTVGNLLEEKTTTHTS